MNKLLILFFTLWFSAFLKAQNNYPNVINYTINLEITDFAGASVSGSTVLQFSADGNNLGVISLDLLALDIDSIVSDDFDVISYTYNDTLIEITPSVEITPTDTFYMAVYYHGHPVIDPSGWGGFYFTADRAFNLGVGFEDVPHNYGRVWFPCVDNFTDRATYNCNITVLENHMAICGGELLNVTEVENGKHTYQWFLSDEIPTYLASVAVGNYSLVEHTYHGIEGDIPVELYVYPTSVGNVAGTFINLDTIISIFEHKFGPYRWQRVGYVAVPFNSGAMEHATNIALPTFAITGNTSYQDLIAHEFAHHWFGDLITCSTAADMWINEGWATYSESIFREFLFGRINMLNYRRDYHSEVLRYAHIEDGGFLSLNAIPIDKTYCTTAYEKGASVAHALRGYLGDELFFNAITALLEEYRFNAISSEQMRDFLTNYTGVDLTDWFDGWVFSPGFPHYSIDSVTTVTNSKSYDVTVYVKQKLRGKTEFINSNRVPITFIDENFNDTTCWVYFDGETGNASFQLTFNPVFSFCDYYETISDATIDQHMFLKNTNTQNLAKCYIRIKPLTLSADSVFIRITHNWVPPDTMKTKIPGIFLANNRYWTVEGNFVANSTMKAEFQYGNAANSSVTGYLDNDFINNSLDSLVLMYRSSKAVEWQIVESTNSTVVKRITTENLLSGEYALGIKNWDAWIKVPEVTKNNNSVMKVSPNPAQSIIRISFDKFVSGILRITDISGNIVYSASIENKNLFTLNLCHLTDGIYFIQFIDTDNSVDCSKLIINKTF